MGPPSRFLSEPTLISSFYYLSFGFNELKTTAAKAPPMKLEMRKIHRFFTKDTPITVTPIATAGLKAAPDMEPTEKAPTVTVNPIARP
jgi:hypothetical protein